MNSPAQQRIAEMLPTVRHELPPGGWIDVLPHVVPEHEALLAKLVATLPLRSETLKVRGKEVLTPRLMSWHGDPGATYRYSGRMFEPNPWTPELADVRDRLEALLDARFNSVLVNYYRDGNDAIAFHADAERELGPDAPHNVLIASVSLGSPRRFVVKARNAKTKLEFDLGNGDLYVMGGGTQRHWVHGVPRTARSVGPRVSLTFRIVRGTPGRERAVTQTRFEAEEIDVLGTLRAMELAERRRG